MISGSQRSSCTATVIRLEIRKSPAIRCTLEAKKKAEKEGKGEKKYKGPEGLCGDGLILFLAEQGPGCRLVKTVYFIIYFVVRSEFAEPVLDLGDIVQYS